jgi:hypothetical protein
VRRPDQLTCRRLDDLGCSVPLRGQKLESPHVVSCNKNAGQKLESPHVVSYNEMSLSPLQNFADGVPVSSGDVFAEFFVENAHGFHCAAAEVKVDDAADFAVCHFENSKILFG